MLRLVIDTNVFVSAVLKDKSVPALAVHLALRRGVVLKSAATEKQLFDVLARPHLSQLIAPSAQEWMKTILAAAETVVISETIAACRDPTDDKFLELAVSGKADFIVSGDADLLALHPFRGIPVVAPAAFLQAAS